MKNAFKITIAFLFLIWGFYACKKKSDITIDDQNLTECLQGNCTYEYVNNSIIVNQPMTVMPGQYRVFSAKKENGFSTTTIYFQAPMQGDSFLLTDADILAGKVKHFFSCASCDYYKSTPIAGTVKGIKVKRINTASEKWLLDATIVLAAENSKIPVDTVYIKQYFNLAVK